MTLLLLSFACTSPKDAEPDETDTDTDADTDSDTDADTDSDTDSDTDADTDADTDSDTDADTDTDTSDLRTLDTCGTSISADAPAFFRDFFRCVTITVADDQVAILTSDLPPHPSPYYDASSANWVEFDTQGGTHHQNPNQISAQTLIARIPLEPVAKGLTITDDLIDVSAGTSSEEYHEFGVALDGVALFHGVAAPGDDLNDEQYTFDLYDGHPQDTGIYHYHSPSPGPLEAVAYAGYTTSTTPGEGDIEIYGIMCDGTVVLGCTELDGSTPTDDLDAQLGHVHDMVGADGTVYFTERYHTHLCAALNDRIFTPEIQYYEGCPGMP